MAKVVFIQRTAVEWLGVMYLSAVLKSHGHQCSMVVESEEGRDAAAGALDEGADVFAFSCLATDFRWALQKAATIKQESDSLVIMGGTQVTLNPEEAIRQPQVDVVCRGEGEGALLDLVDAIDRREDFSRIANLWVKRDGTVHRNEMRRLIEDLDALPFPDRGLYSKYTVFRESGKRPLHLGRGCPYGCTFCHNRRKRDLYAGKGRFVRWRSMDSVLREVEEMARSSFVSVLHFADDGFGINREWLSELLPGLSGLLGEQRPALFANMRADMVTDDLCETFRGYGAHLMRIRIAVECGDEQYRREVLKKVISNEELSRAAGLFREYGIDFATYNMVGLPGETLDQALETLRLNLELRPSRAICFIYQPYPGTDLANYALESDVVDPETVTEFAEDGLRGFFESYSLLRQKNIKQLENVQRVFELVARYPVFFPLAKRLVRFESLSLLLRLLYRLYMRLVIRHRRATDAY
ncbi:MAG: B12-binding domain-containing radical SAM protein [Acidobacteria bacterium]|nr:B12-binding domain-containing radical SAM protein [Acidobacteriota bacterium]